MDEPRPGAGASVDNAGSKPGRAGVLGRFDQIVGAAPARGMSLLEEFKAFAFKGNVVDLAVAVVIGTAFSKIVDSLVNNILMPLLGVVLPGKGGYTEWKWTIRGEPIPYGLFLGQVVNFVIVAAALFVFIVKFLGWLMRSKPPTPALTKDQELLTEIRNLLRERPAAP